MKNFFNKYTIIVGAICLVVGFSFGAGGYYLLLPYRTLKITSNVPIPGLDLMTDTAKEISNIVKPVVEKKIGEDFMLDDNIKVTYKWTKEETNRLSDENSYFGYDPKEGMKWVILAFDAENIGKKAVSLDINKNKDFVLFDENDREYESDYGYSLDNYLFNYQLVPALKSEKIVVFSVPKDTNKFKYIIYHGKNEDYKLILG